jgi:hypothetical protein
MPSVNTLNARSIGACTVIDVRAIGTADRKRPVLRRLAARSRGRGRQRVARVSFRLSEASRVRIRLARKLGGRYRRVLELLRSLPAGRTRLTLARRRGRSLRPGSYQSSKCSSTVSLSHSIGTCGQ